MEVKLRKIAVDPWSGVEFYPNCNHTLRPYMTRKQTKYTGFGKEYKNLEDRERLESELGVDLRPGSSFWKTFFIKVGSEVVYIDTDNPMDEIKYHFLKNHYKVKTSITANKPGAVFYLDNIEETANVVNERNRIKRAAYKEFDKMKGEDMRKALRLYGDGRSTGVSDAVAEERLIQRIEQNPQHFLDIWVNNKNRATEFLIKEAVSSNVVTKNKNIYSYGTVILGKTLQEAIIYLDNAENNDIKAAIINEANIK